MSEHTTILRKQIEIEHRFQPGDRVEAVRGVPRTVVSLRWGDPHPEYVLEDEHGRHWPKSVDFVDSLYRPVPEPEPELIFVEDLLDELSVAQVYRIAQDAVACMVLGDRTLCAPGPPSRWASLDPVYEICAENGIQL